MIAEGEFKFGLTHSSFDNSLPSFSEISGKKNLGYIVHLESIAYVVLTKNYDCSVKSFICPQIYSVAMTMAGLF